MKIVELTKENITQYLDQCIALQTFLVGEESDIDSNKFVDTAQADNNYFLSVVADGKLLGMGLISKLSHPVNITGYINNIVVHPDARGKGLFVLIMDTLEAKAKEWGCTDVALTCSREKVQSMYERRNYSSKDTHFYLLKLEK